MEKSFKGKHRTGPAARYYILKNDIKANGLTWSSATKYMTFRTQINFTHPQDEERIKAIWVKPKLGVILHKISVPS